MKKSLLYSLLVIVSFSYTSVFSQSYDASFVSASFNTDYYTFVMKREGQRVNAKYFAASYGNESVYASYKKWKEERNRNIILISSGTYMDGCDGGNGSTNGATPTGLTIQSGNVVNSNLKDFDGLVVVYPNGGIAVSNLDLGNLSVEGFTRKLDIRKSAIDRASFIDWAKKANATVFQTHLLAYNNELTIFDPKNSNCLNCKENRERRFLAACRDDENILYHVIIHCPANTTIYDGANNVLNYLKKQKEMKDVIFLINLDTGCQDVFEYYNSDGTKNGKIQGRSPIKDAANLLVYYFQ